MSQLDDDIRAADELGISYGYYKAMTYDSSQPMAIPYPQKRKYQRRFTDEAAFALWQNGMTDTAIGKELGVSQQSITKWRNQLELPLLSKKQVNTTKYRLAKLPDGTCIAVQTDEI